MGSKIHIRIGLAAALAGLAGLVLAAPLSALPPPGDDGEAIERPPTTRPPSTTTPTTTPQAPRVLESLDVTTDSVVATATIHYTGSPSLVTVQWSDGTSSSRNPSDPTDSPFPDPWAPSDPSGVSVFTHAYAAPSDGAPLPVAITAQIGAETLTRVAVVTPRYRVTHQTAYFGTEDACDSSFELDTNWGVNRYVADLLERRWEFDWANAALSGHELENSVLTFEVTVEEGRATPIRYAVWEEDPFLTDLFHNPSGTFVDLDPLLGNRTVEIGFEELTDVASPCHATITVDVTVALLTPGVPGGPVAGQ